MFWVQLGTPSFEELRGASVHAQAFVPIEAARHVACIVRGQRQHAASQYDRLVGMAFHSKWLAIRNNFGIAPKGPHGPPWVPSLGPFGPLGPLGGGGGGGVPGVPLGPRVRHPVEATKGRLES